MHVCIAIRSGLFAHCTTNNTVKMTESLHARLSTHLCTNAVPQEWERRAGQVLGGANTEDYTNQDLCCPKCGQEFARERMIRGTPAHKIIGGKVKIK